MCGRPWYSATRLLSAFGYCCCLACKNQTGKYRNPKRGTWEGPRGPLPYFYQLGTEILSGVLSLMTFPTFSMTSPDTLILFAFLRNDVNSPRRVKNVSLRILTSSERSRKWATAPLFRTIDTNWTDPERNTPNLSLELGL